MAGFWMIRAGEGGYLADEFLSKACVGVGFDGVGDFTAFRTLEAVKATIRTVYPDQSAVQVALSAGVAHKFRTLIATGDRVVTYDPETRQYHLGTVDGEYEYRPGYLTDYAHVRRVNWNSHVSRDDLTLASRNSLGSAITIFEPGMEVLQDLLQDRAGSPRTLEPLEGTREAREEFERIYDDQLSRSHEFIKDLLNRLDARDMERLVAALLRALGFRTRITPGGPDRGRDIVASVDGLGLQPPRILCEVKHRKGAMGAPEIRSFTGGLRNDDRGLYVSTGGFSKEAKYEADRASVPVTLLDLDDLARLLVEHYDSFDAAGRALAPLERIYWPLA